MTTFAKKLRAALAVGLAMTFLSVPASALSSDIYNDAQTESGGAYKYDVATGETTYLPPEETETYSDETEGFSPGYDPFADEENSYGVSTLGFRDMYLISDPANDSSCRNTVHIEAVTQSGEKIYGTGFTIGPNAVATAGHLLCNDGFGEDKSSWAWIKSATITPAMNKGKNPAPYGTANATYFICVRAWAKDYKEYDDWGIIELDSNIGNKVGWLGLQYQSKTYNGTEIMVNGYPKFYYDNEELYKSYGKIRESESKLLYSRDARTAQGNSGGPCYIDSDDTGYTAIGIVIGCYNDNNDQFLESVFRRIDKSLFDILVEYRTSTL